MSQDFSSKYNEKLREETSNCGEEVNKLKSEDEDFFATGDLFYDENPDKEKKNEHHLLSLMNAFKLTD